MAKVHRTLIMLEKNKYLQPHLSGTVESLVEYLKQLYPTSNQSVISKLSHDPDSKYSLASNRGALLLSSNLHNNDGDSSDDTSSKVSWKTTTTGGLMVTSNKHNNRHEQQMAMAGLIAQRNSQHDEGIQEAEREHDEDEESPIKKKMPMIQLEVPSSDSSRRINSRTTSGVTQGGKKNNSYHRGDHHQKPQQIRRTPSQINEENNNKEHSQTRMLIQSSINNSSIQGKRGSQEAKNNASIETLQKPTQVAPKEQFFSTRAQLQNSKSRKSNYSQQPKPVDVTAHPSELRPKELERMFSGSEEEGGETPYSASQVTTGQWRHNMHKKTHSQVQEAQFRYSTQYPEAIRQQSQSTTHSPLSRYKRTPQEDQVLQDMMLVRRSHQNPSLNQSRPYTTALNPRPVMIKERRQESARNLEKVDDMAMPILAGTNNTISPKGKIKNVLRHSQQYDRGSSQTRVVLSSNPGQTLLANSYYHHNPKKPLNPSNRYSSNGKGELPPKNARMNSIGADSNDERKRHNSSGLGHHNQSPPNKWVKQIKKASVPRPIEGANHGESQSSRQTNLTFNIILR
ncbi:hypothetical protein FGO68_gene15750 [Halteria grandinella]|uniref:Uncharacterized protein n=1 Tax=Halteria grandinella TaxID=5974 RepID=A0A8J8SWH7_HALGN|nr:hypothetical protein FGO68_gene15750 [Halteria grandinella]